MNIKRETKATSLDKLYKNIWYVASSVCADETKLFVTRIGIQITDERIKPQRTTDSPNPFVETYNYRMNRQEFHLSNMMKMFAQLCSATVGS